MKVRGTQETVPQIEVSVDTVYVRSNISRIDRDDFVGWEYNEVQYTKDDYIVKIAEASDELETQNADLWYANIMLEAKATTSEQEIADLWYTVLTGGA